MGPAGDSLLRALPAALIAAWIAPCLARAACHSQCFRSMLVLLALLPPVGAAYAMTGLGWAWVHHPYGAELAWQVLAAGRLLPLAAGVAWLCPPGEPSPSAWHVLRLAPGGACSPWKRCQWFLSGPGRPAVAGGLAAFGLAVADFDLAARLARPAWTIAVFDRLFGGAAWWTCLPVLIPGALAAAISLGMAVSLVMRPGPGSRHADLRPSPWPWMIIATLGVAFLGPMTAVVIIPALATHAAAGWFRLLDPFISSLLVAMAASCLALVLTNARQTRNPWWQRLVWILAALGLAGPLPLAVFTVGWIGATTTPAALVLVEALGLLPMMLLLDLLLHPHGPDPAIFQLGLLAEGDPYQRRLAARLRWRLLGRRHFLPFAFGIIWVMAESAAATLLTPPGLPLLMPILHNHMHYGHLPAIATGLCLVVAGPWLCLALLAGLARLRWGSRPDQIDPPCQY